MHPGLRSTQHRTLPIAAWLAAVAATQAGCRANSCSDRDERRLARLVELVVGEPGPTADSAEEALVAAGAGAILYLETGLYDAGPTGRRRVARVLTRIGDPAAAPILAHLAEHDSDPDVRNDAEAGLRALERRPP